VTDPRTQPPSGTPPPRVAPGPDGGDVDLVALAQAICRRYDAEFPDERTRYGPAGLAWCEHDNQHLLNWAIADVHGGFLDLLEQVAWLARVLAARDFPLPRLARNLELGAEVVAEELGDERLAARLRDAAASVDRGDRIRPCDRPAPARENQRG
jgi:hypothetical protein